MSKKSAEIIIQEAEAMLWDCNIINTTDPDKLQKAVFFYIGKVCYLRGERNSDNWNCPNLYAVLILIDMCILNTDQKIAMVAFISYMLIIRE